MEIKVVAGDIAKTKADAIIVPFFEGMEQQEKYNMPVDQLDLSIRAMNCLRRGGITTVGEFMSAGEKKLTSLRNFGQNSRREVEERIASLGLCLTPTDGDIATIDKALDRAISRLISQGEIKGKLNEITIIHSLGNLPAALVVFIDVWWEKRKRGKNKGGEFSGSKGFRSN